MNRKHFLVLILCVLMSDSAWAHGWHDGDEDDEDDCEPARPVCFNVYCRYQKKDAQNERKCEAAAKFKYWVSGRGEEIWGDSQGSSNPVFEVKCEDALIFSGTGRRFTDDRGTRIQALNGPFPGLELPRDSLESRRRVVRSVLELSHEKMEGVCTVYTGESFRSDLNIKK